MTGSLLVRQHSSTVGHPIKNKMSRPKLRRCSSADDHNLVEVSINDKQFKKKLSNKSDQTTSDVDSGIEDFDQQVNNLTFLQANDVNEEETFRACEDEEVQEPILQKPMDAEQAVLDRIHRDLSLAASVTDEEKKDLFSDTSVVFHGEFATRISVPIAVKNPGCRYYLYSEEEVIGNPAEWPGFTFFKLDNAKAQFKCLNIDCNRSWTSMRARISFAVSQPQPYGFVVLKIYGQNCQNCETPAEALWYMDEVCRVMKNLAESISTKFNLSIIDCNQIPPTEMIQCVSRSSRRVVYHDPSQRKGKMLASHDRNHCEACQRGWCFA